MANFIEMFKSMPRRKQVGIVLISIVFFVLFNVIPIYTDIRSQREAEKKRQENLSYNQQLDALNNVQGSLNNLIEFVELQKSKLKESEDLVNNLKNEQEKLKPVVEADRRTVEALLQLQSEKAERSVWRERYIGFGLGVLSSILASIILNVFSTRLRKRNSPPSEGSNA